jgi:surface-anchored protein
MKTPSLILAGLLSASVAAHAGKVVFSNIHGDLDMGYEDGELELIFHDHTHDVEYDPKDVILQVNGSAKTTVPNSGTYSFLGQPGDPVWILPAVQDPNLLFLGTASEEIPTGIFVGDAVWLSLEAVKGPGEFALFAIDPFGTPVVLMNSRDGITDSDGLSAPAGGHTDYNFAFSKPGTYHITLEATGVLLDGTVISSGKVTYTFKVLRAGSAKL